MIIQHRCGIVKLDTLLEVDELFQIGDKIIYPMHGAGVIKSIEEKEFLGEKHRYYVINMPISNMQVMVPIGKLSKLGIRPIVNHLKLEDVLRIFHHGETTQLLPWKQRYDLNMKKIKTGKIEDGAEVVRDLMRRNKEKALNSSEKRMLDNARQILISELMLIGDCTELQATDLLNNSID